MEGQTDSLNGRKETVDLENLLETYLGTRLNHMPRPIQRGQVQLVSRSPSVVLKMLVLGKTCPILCPKRQGPRWKSCIQGKRFDQLGVLVSRPAGRRILVSITGNALFHNRGLLVRQHIDETPASKIPRKLLLTWRASTTLFDN